MENPEAEPRQHIWNKSDISNQWGEDELFSDDIRPYANPWINKIGFPTSYLSYLLLYNQAISKP